MLVKQVSFLRIGITKNSFHFKCDTGWFLEEWMVEVEMPREKNDNKLPFAQKNLFRQMNS